MTTITAYQYKRNKTLSHFNIGNNIIEIKTGAFLKSSLGSVDISNSVIIIEKFALSYKKI